MEPLSEAERPHGPRDTAGAKGTAFHPGLETQLMGFITMYQC